MHNVAKAHSDLKQYDKAIDILREILVLQKKVLPEGHPHLIQTIYSLANQHGKIKKYAEALALHQEAFELRKAKLGPNNRQTLFSQWGVATNLLNLDRDDEAIGIIDDCLQRAVGDAAHPSFAGLANLRLRYSEKRSDAAGCKKTAELWENLNCADAESWFNAARYRAVTCAVLRSADNHSSGNASMADAEADLAMIWLKKAIAAGFRDSEKLQSHDLNALRERADFRALIESIGSARSNKK
jgi:tetratricopeptide (TPR) repeat protein